MTQVMHTPRFARQVVGNLIASLLQGSLAIALIPLATRILSPEDYGIYGVTIALIGLIVAFCETGATYVLYGYVVDISDDERSSLISTILVLSALTGLTASSLLWISWPLLDHFDSVFSSPTLQEKILACLVIPCRTMWVIASPILISQMRSGWVAACISLQSIVGFSAVLLTLYYFHQERASLFWGYLIGTAAGLLLAIYAIGLSGWVMPRMHWLSKVACKAPGAWIAGLVENLKITIESSLIIRAEGNAGLGNYNLARLHHGVLMQGTNALANVLWPLALRDAKDQSSQFMRVRLAWNFVYLCLTLAGMVFVFFGDHIVDLLTNGKFNQAATWIPFLIVYLLIQNSGKPATAVIFAANGGNAFSTVRIVTAGIAIVAIILLVPHFGIPALIAVSIAEITLMRIFISFIARRIRTIPFSDKWVLVGCATITITWLLIHNLIFTISERISLFLFVSTLLLFAGRSIATQAKIYKIRDIWALFRK